MARIRLSGVQLNNPERPIDELHQVLVGKGCVIETTALKDYYFCLGLLIGKWDSKRNQLQVNQVETLLKRMADELHLASKLLAGLEEGLRTDIEIAVADAVIDALASYDEVRSRKAASDMLRPFCAAAETVSRACSLAARSQPTGKDKRGARKKDWYDDFTRLLLNIAHDSRLKPTLHNRGSDGPEGWLFEAATALELFFPKGMQSPSAQARGQRLTRSKRRLRRQI